MKTSILTLLSAVLLLVAANQAYAKVWRVNNIPGISADFSSFATAHTVAVSGDTLYVEGSATSYGSVTVTKQLTIIGSGYLLIVNDSTQANPSRTNFSSITFNSGSQGSVLTGVQAINIDIETDDITIIRNYVYYTSSSGNGIEVGSSKSNIVIAQNFIHMAYSSSGPVCIQFGSNHQNVLVANNIIIRGNNLTSSSVGYAINTSSSGTATFSNNVVFGDWRCYNCIVDNNIQGNGTFYQSTTYPNATSNNIGNSTQFGVANGNQQLVNMNTVFNYVGSLSEDNYYTLKTGSPAIGAGNAGQDCGAFGGALGYKLSGMPGIPAIFGATVPSSGTTATGINVNIKAKSHK